MRDILRRIAERGRHLALQNLDTHYVDLFQHILDELERTTKDNLES